MNLLSNAIKFTPEGGTVELKATFTGDECVSICVRDTGIGMSGDDMAVALMPFGQVDGSHARKREGTGLGLPIAKALIELHGGLMSIESDRGKGTEVEVQLPIAGGDRSRLFSAATLRRSNSLHAMSAASPTE